MVFNVSGILFTNWDVLTYRSAMYLHPPGVCRSFLASFKVVFREVVPVHRIDHTTYVQIAILHVYWAQADQSILLMTRLAVGVKET